MMRTPAPQGVANRPRLLAEMGKREAQRNAGDLYQSPERGPQFQYEKDRDGNRRTAYSLRHTYICMRLMEGADIYQVAKNCRTDSVRSSFTASW